LVALGIVDVTLFERTLFDVTLFDRTLVRSCCRWVRSGGSRPRCPLQRQAMLITADARLLAWQAQLERQDARQ